MKSLKLYVFGVKKSVSSCLGFEAKVLSKVVWILGKKYCLKLSGFKAKSVSKVV